MGGDADNWYKVALFAAGACVVSAIAVLTGPSGTHKVPTRDIGARATADARSTKPMAVHA